MLMILNRYVFPGVQLSVAFSLKPGNQVASVEFAGVFAKNIKAESGLTEGRCSKEWEWSASALVQISSVAIQLVLLTRARRQLDSYHS